MGPRLNRINAALMRARYSTLMKKTVFLAALAAVLMPLSALAFQMQWTARSPVAISHPTVSTAYFGQMTGEPHSYTFTLAKPTAMYFTVLVPDASSTKKDVSAALVDVTRPDVPVGVVLGQGAWRAFTYQGDHYFRGEEYRATIPAGNYQIIVWSGNNDSAYGLIVGEHEPFVFGKIAGAISTLPTIRSAFFGRPAVSALLAPLIYGPILVILILILTVVWYLRRRA